MERTVKVGKMPGKITEVVVDQQTTIGEALSYAELSPEGYDIKVDGNIKSADDLVGNANLIILAKQVKGN